MRIGVVVHPVNTLAHPTVPTGYRWAVHAGVDFHDAATCLNAGWEPDSAHAAMAGEAAAVCAVKAVMLCGRPSNYETHFIDVDPTGTTPGEIIIGAR